MSGKSNQYVAGCDVGSTTGKAVIMHNDKVVASSIVLSEIDPEKTAVLALQKALESVENLTSIDDLDYLIGTGYGRNEVPFANENISEISCHAMGTHYCDPMIKTVVDIGGQDVKGISIDDDGSVLEFVMNDKCAAGTGRFFEAMSRSFKMDIETFSSLSLSAKRIVPVTAQCSVFAETEVISLLANKVSAPDIAAGIQAAVAKRCFSLLKRVGIKPKITVTGGCSKNKGLSAALTRLLRQDISPLSIDPQLMGALGAAVMAQRKIVSL